ncbi:MAG: type II toxin-antitoxin system mRNA interferase toxin, RelE/StbE family [Halobacteriota archaeon]
MNLPYDIEIGDKLKKKLEKLEKKDKSIYNTIIKKILQVADNPYIGKPLHGKLKGKKRVHIGHFVLIYGIDDKERGVIFLDFTHHDEAYK